MRDNELRGGDRSEGEGRDCDSRQKNVSGAAVSEGIEHKGTRAASTAAALFSEDAQLEYWERLGGCYDP